MAISIIQRKSFVFALKIVDLCKRRITSRKKYVMSKQLLRSGTSIGANVREGMNAESRRDFINKLSISQKKCDETHYWLELLQETNYLNNTEFVTSSNDAAKLLKILRSIILSTKQKGGII